MIDQMTIKHILTNTISNYYIHLPLIFIEYACFIFPSLFNAAIKIHYSSYPIAFFQSTVLFNVELIFPIKYIHNNTYSICKIGLMIILLILLLSYYLIYFFGIPSHPLLKIPMIILINFIDIFLFRYFSLITIDGLIWLFIESYQGHTFVHNIMASLFLIIFLIYFMTSYYYIINTAVFLTISNPSLVKKEKKYPYDHLSINYQVFFLVIKVFIALEYNYFNTATLINNAIVVMNICIIILCFVLLFSFSIVIIFLNFNCSVFYANFELNYLRNIIVLFSCLICILNSIIPHENYIFAIVIAVNMTLILIYYENKTLFTFLLKRQSITYELLLLLIIQDVKHTPFFDYRQIINSCYSKHIDTCKQAKCSFCSNTSTSLHDYIIVFYKYLKNEKKKTVSVYESLVKLFYYKLKGKQIKYFRQYYSMIRKYKNENVVIMQTLRIVVEDWLLNEKDEQCYCIENLVKVRKLEQKIKTLLDNMNGFLLEKAKINHPETVIDLSNQIEEVVKEFKTRTTYQQQSTDMQLDDNSVKTINDILIYTTNILRFIIQTFINQDIKDLPLIDIEHLDEFLNLHFSSDHIIIGVIDLDNAQSQNEVNLIKITGELSRNSYHMKYLSDFFPKEITQEGINLLNKEIYSNKTTQKAFLFPLQIKAVASYIRYSFTLINTLEKNRILLYGDYAKEKKRALLLNHNRDGSIEILSFCHDILTLIQFRRRWILYLKEARYSVYLSTIFKCIKKNKEKGDNSYECEFDYEYFLHNSSVLLKELRELTEFKANPKNEVQLQTAIEKLEKHKGFSMTLCLDKVTTYANGVSLYTSTVKTKGHGSLFTEGYNEKRNIYQNDPCDSFRLNFQADTFQSTTTSNKATKVSSLFLKGSQMTQYQMLTSELKSKIQRETVRLSWFSTFMIAFNLLLIIICVAFLVTQVKKSTDLDVLCELFFQLKSMRLCFTNFINALSATVCFIDHIDEVECHNSFGEFSIEFMKMTHLENQGFDLLKYTTDELGYKANFTQELLLKIKEFLYDYKDASFASLLEDPMTYYEFDMSTTKLKMMKKTLTFEEGLREYLNTIFIISHSDTHYELVPLNYISYKDGEYDFSSKSNNDTSPPQELTEIQKQLYKGMINYMNFYYSFDNGEKYIMNDIESNSRVNHQMNISFMITLASLNIVLVLCCVFNIVTAYHLFKILIVNIINQVDKNHICKAMTYKLDDLNVLIRLYDKNPNEIIKKILKYQPMTPSNLEKSIKANDNGSTPEMVTQSDHVHFGSQFFQGLLGKILQLLIYIFAFFFMIIIIFDIVISDKYAKVFKVFNFASLYYSFEDGVYSNIAFTALIHFCNISNADFAGLIGRDNPPHGILNELLRQSMTDIKSLAGYQITNSSLYPLMANSFNYSCDGMFYGFEDIFMTTVSDIHGVDYRHISKTVCNFYNSLVLPGFFFLRSDIIDRTHKLANKTPGKTYEDITSFDNSFDLYELFTISFFVFRPSCFHYRSTVLLPTLSDNFENYVILVGIYLGVNISLEIIIFFIVKWVIVVRLTVIRDNLYLFNNCVN